MCDSVLQARKYIPDSLKIVSLFGCVICRGAQQMMIWPCVSACCSQL
jgi:hypothetical protein